MYHCLLVETNPSEVFGVAWNTDKSLMIMLLHPNLFTSKSWETPLFGRLSIVPIELYMKHTNKKT